MEGKISQVFWTADREFAFQRVGNFYELYGSDGGFRKEFRSFWAMEDYIRDEQTADRKED